MSLSSEHFHLKLKKHYFHIDQDVKSNKKYQNIVNRGSKSWIRNLMLNSDVLEGEGTLEVFVWFAAGERKMGQSSCDPGWPGTPI